MTTEAQTPNNLKSLVNLIKDQSTHIINQNKDKSRNIVLVPFVMSIEQRTERTFHKRNDPLFDLQRAHQWAHLWTVEQR